MSQVLAKPTPSGSGIPAVPVPHLVPFGPVSESAQPWILLAAQVSSFVPSGKKKLTLPGASRNLFASCALPRSTLPVTRELQPLLAKPFKGDSALVVNESSLISLEEVGRQLLELASIAETLLRTLSRSMTDSLVPFMLSEEQNADDIATLLAALARVNEEQMASLLLAVLSCSVQQERFVS